LVTRRLFCDPGSVSTGWAVFEDKTFKASGTIFAPKGNHAFDRLFEIFSKYSKLTGRVDEVHFEQFGGRPSHILHWAVGAIAMALYPRTLHMTQDVNVSSWQAFCKWKTDREPLKDFKKLVMSEDELAAIGLGVFYTQTLGGSIGKSNSDKALDPHTGSTGSRKSVRRSSQGSKARNALQGSVSKSRRVG